MSLRGWQIKRTGEQYELRKGGVTLVLDYLHARTMAAEILAWERLYLPAFSLKGKTVLDIGAGAGETAQFYLSHGAEMIIAVEPTRDAFECLKANAERNHWNAELHNEAFNLRHLNIEHDFMKMDCEGCEYDTILSSYEDTLRKFSHMQIEYHYGYRNLKEKLEGSGFTVSVTSPRYSVNSESPNSRMYVGWLYAKRNN